MVASTGLNVGASSKCTEDAAAITRVEQSISWLEGRCHIVKVYKRASRRSKKAKKISFSSFCRHVALLRRDFFAVFDKFLAKTAVLFLHECAFELNATPEPRWVRVN